MSSLFTVRITTAEGSTAVDYKSIRECIDDKALSRLLDTSVASCTIWLDDLRLTGTPIDGALALHEALVDNARVILRRLL